MALYPTTEKDIKPVILYSTYGKTTLPQKMHVRVFLLFTKWKRTDYIKMAHYRITKIWVGLFQLKKIKK